MRARLAELEHGGRAQRIELEPLSLEHVAEQVLDIKTDALVVRSREAFDIGVLEDIIQRFFRAGRRILLEKRIAVQPRVGFRFADSILLFQRRIKLGLHFGKGALGKLLEPVEQGEDPLRGSLVDRAGRAC